MHQPTRRVSKPPHSRSCLVTAIATLSAAVVLSACGGGSNSSAAQTFGATRLALKTDGRNLRSQAAIERLGAQREGALRRHMRMPDGFIRDTVYFSILAEEWPAVRARLEERLGR